MGSSWSDCSSSVKSKLNCCCGKIKCCGRSGEYEVYELPRPPSCDAADKACADVMSIKSIDLCFSLNGEDHHTDKFELMNRPLDRSLVVRRGQPFKIDITLSRQYNAEKDAVSFIFSVADEEKPKFGTGALVGVPLLTAASTPSSPESWTAVLESQISSHIMVQITPAANCIVGPWKVDIDTKKQGDGSLSYTHPGNIYILFNPWCPLDEVYMEGRDNREEYILADSGLIWRGSYNRLRPSIWKFAQFEKDVLECSLYLLTEIGKLRGHGRGDPMLAARVLSAAVNAQDDSGAVVGNWSTDFGGGTHPTQWVGSMQILQKYYKKKKPVKYGQCWVFAGVLTTICRAVGIPARVVTAFSAAHDTHSSLTVDYFVDEKGAIMEEYNSDSIWNYHVWSEVWMKRPDLGPEYGGWQALDATPQQPSDNIFRCGPASVLAVKQGEILKPYDNAFLFAEVNADKVYWKYTGPTQPLKMIRKDTVSIGQFISTKAVLKWEREDITENYKFPEKTVEERDTMLKALQKSESLFARYYLNEQFNDVRFDFALRDDIKIGEDFSVVVVIKNISMRKEHEVSINLRVDTVTYMGKISDAVKQQNFKVILKPEDITEVKMTVTFDEYYKKLVDQCAFNIACMANVSETKYEYFAQDDFRVRKPDIKIIVNGTPTSKQEFEAVIRLENPLPIPLRKGKFMIEGIGLEKQLEIPLKENVAPGEFATTTIKLTPPWGGRHSIAAKFTSKELEDVDGFLVINVKVPKDYMPGIETNEV